MVSTTTSQTGFNGLPIVLKFDLEQTPPGTIRHYWLRLAADGMGNPMCVPLMVARGAADGPVLGLTAAIHGDELNGISVIQRLFADLDVSELKGCVVAIPVVNIPGFNRQQRIFADGSDINHLMPGKKDGNASQVYAYRLVNRFLQHIDYLLDLHTASRGRVNSYYVRADMSQESTRKLALLQNPQLIVHNPPNDGTFRGTADDLNIPAITLEVGNPGVYQKKLIRSGLVGVHNVLSHLGMTDDEILEPNVPTILCKKSYWVYTETGGLLHVHVDLLERVEKGQLIASLRNVFGEMIQEYFAPEDGVVIGKSISPVNQSGGRILHLGIE
ncbi:succinylglutamate desuccinylase/aspartoacylase family protein [Neolewinella aurantiaca]|uniref:Succinylglutamate desuccinylase/aspartoacylase family protein n=1 Tax=Neolewinella aurantiaca TaxID=2602767 RepID=A0A5C7FIG1_9BACT|nr:succinylglutamate desuccinylase/aspartoacylase family protein [Neolewinella aurantiaca]TXF90316.1 succinylglutamate desuccinylase/aspartoacylase family protein [Neolewinella aurantiaca]